MKTKELGPQRKGGKHPQGQSKGRDEGGGKESQRKPQKGLRKTQLLSPLFFRPFVLLFSPFISHSCF